MYQEFTGMEGPTDDTDPKDNRALDFLKLVWPSALCELIAIETNRYAAQNATSDWSDTCSNEIWSFLGVIIFMGFHRLPRICNYWNTDEYLGLPALQKHMPLTRFWDLWCNMHLVDNGEADHSDRLYKVRPLIKCLTGTFTKHYNPSQEIAVDEAMIKCRGQAKGKVFMPNKPVKRGFKVWCCSCSCCGYLCNLQVYSGKSSTQKDDPDAGTISKVVCDLLLDLYADENHVVYMDRYFTSGPLVDALAVHKIYTVGTIKKMLKDFPMS